MPSELSIYQNEQRVGYRKGSDRDIISLRTDNLGQIKVRARAPIGGILGKIHSLLKIPTGRALEINAPFINPSIDTLRKGDGTITRRYEIGGLTIVATSFPDDSEV